MTYGKTVLGDTDGAKDGTLLERHAQRVAAAYGHAADHYELPPLSFWDRFGDETVSRAGLAPGQAVLDLCCGAGASAIPAARAVGANGRVLGIDLASPLLELARARARREGLTNVVFEQGDATSTGLSSGTFDAAVCVFGVFFAPDMPAFVSEMWRLTRPGGIVAITTWGPDLFEPASGLFWDAVRELEPRLFKAFNPWDEVTTAPALLDLFSRAGITGAVAQAAAGYHDLPDPDSFWDVVLGTGYRATVDALTGEQRQTLRNRVLDQLRSRSITSLRTNTVFGMARRPI